MNLQEIHVLNEVSSLFMDVSVFVKNREAMVLDRVKQESIRIISAIDEKINKLTFIVSSSDELQSSIVNSKRIMNSYHGSPHLFLETLTSIQDAKTRFSNAQNNKNLPEMNTPANSLKFDRAFEFK